MSKRQQNVVKSVTPRRTRSGRVLNQQDQTVDENQQKSRQSKSGKNRQQPAAVTNQEVTIPNETITLETPTQNDLNIAVEVITGSRLENGQQQQTAEVVQEQPTAAETDQQSTAESLPEQPTAAQNDSQLPIVGDDQDEQDLETTEHSTLENLNMEMTENTTIENRNVETSEEDTSHHEAMETIEDTIAENQNPVLEDQNLPVLRELINDEDIYVILSDDEDDFVFVQSEDEEDPRINEAVRILEGNLSLNAPSSPSSSPPSNNRTIDLTDSPRPSPMPTFMDSPDQPSPSNQESLQIKCPICFDTFLQIKSSGKRLMSTICGHIFCSGCLPICVRTTKNCPSCRKTLKIKDIHPIFF